MHTNGTLPPVPGLADAVATLLRLRPPLSVEVMGEGVRLTVLLAAVVTPDDLPARLTSSDLPLLRVLATADKPALAKHLASRLGVPYSGALRKRLSRLVKLEALANPGQGYTLTSAGRAALEHLGGPCR